MSVFETYRETCTGRRTLPLEGRPGNALNVEIGKPKDRCLDKKPPHWPESMTATRWLASGGSALVLGLCCQVCPRLCSHGEGRSCWWCETDEMEAAAPKVCVENPVGIMSSRFRKPDQTIQPWQFGHPETKATCLWLRGLPLLQPTQIVEGRAAKVHQMRPSHGRWKARSRTLIGVAEAMAEQWG